MPYRLQEARAAGVPDKDIAEELARRLSYPIDKARAAGVADTEIIDELMKRDSAKAPSAPGGPSLSAGTSGEQVPTVQEELAAKSKRGPLEGLKQYGKEWAGAITDIANLKTGQVNPLTAVGKPIELALRPAANLFKRAVDPEAALGGSVLNLGEDRPMSKDPEADMFVSAIFDTISQIGWEKAISQFSKIPGMLERMRNPKVAQQIITDPRRLLPAPAKARFEELLQVKPTGKVGDLPYSEGVSGKTTVTRTMQPGKQQRLLPAPKVRQMTGGGGLEQASTSVKSYRGTDDVQDFFDLNDAQEAWDTLAANPNVPRASLPKRPQTAADLKDWYLSESNAGVRVLPREGGPPTVEILPHEERMALSADASRAKVTEAERAEQLAKVKGKKPAPLSAEEVFKKQGGEIATETTTEPGLSPRFGEKLSPKDKPRIIGGTRVVQETKDLEKEAENLRNILSKEKLSPEDRQVISDRLTKIDEYLAGFKPPAAKPVEPPASKGGLARAPFASGFRPLDKALQASVPQVTETIKKAESARNAYVAHYHEVAKGILAELRQSLKNVPEERISQALIQESMNPGSVSDPAIQRAAQRLRSEFFDAQHAAVSSPEVRKWLGDVGYQPNYWPTEAGDLHRGQLMFNQAENLGDVVNISDEVAGRTTMFDIHSPTPAGYKPGYLKKRVLEGVPISDVDKLLKNYTTAMGRAAYDIPAYGQARELAARVVEPNSDLQAVVNRYLDTFIQSPVMGKYDIKRGGWTKTLAENMYPAYLGGKLSTPLRNLTQFTNTLSDTGPIATAKGIVKGFKGAATGGSAEIKATGLLNPEQYSPLGEIKNEFLTAVRGTGGKWEKAKKVWDDTAKFVMRPFELSEHTLREGSYFAGLERAKQLGLSTARKGPQFSREWFFQSPAEQFAIDVVNNTQFAYSRLSPTITGIRGGEAPILKVLGSYPIRQGEFLINSFKQAGKAVPVLAKGMADNLLTALGKTAKYGVDSAEKAAAQMALQGGILQLVTRVAFIGLGIENAQDMLPGVKTPIVDLASKVQNGIMTLIEKGRGAALIRAVGEAVASQVPAGDLISRNWVFPGKKPSKDMRLYQWMKGVFEQAIKAVEGGQNGVPVPMQQVPEGGGVPGSSGPVRQP